MTEQIDITQWKQAIRNRSMDILKLVQKLLALCKEAELPSNGALAPLSASLLKNSQDMQNDIQQSTQAELKRVGHELTTSITTCAKLTDALQTKPDDEDIKTRIKNECKTTAALIKTANQIVQDLAQTDLAPVVIPAPVPAVEKSAAPVPPVRVEEAAPQPVPPAKLPTWLQKVVEVSKNASATLQAVEAAAVAKDQAGLVTGAKALSSHCTDLLNQARDFGLAPDAGDAVKERVLGFINVAKVVFKGGDDASKKEMEKAATATNQALKELVAAFEAHGANGTKNSPTDDDLVIDDDHDMAGSLPKSSPPADAPTPRANEAPTPRAHEAPAKTTTRKDSSPLPVHKRSASESSAKLAAANQQATAAASTPKPTDALSPKDASRQLQKEFSSRDPEKVFKVQELLGEGASGAVYRAVHRETKKVVAIKKMQVGVNNIASTVKEIKIMKDLKSPFTLKYYGCYQKDDCIWIIMEYADGGSVQDIIDARENEDVVLSEAQIAQISVQVIKALDYLHGMKKIHRDIKAGNILITSRGAAKLADFGISAQQVGDEKRTTTIGSSYWMAPETLMGAGYDSKADIWSLGITLLEMAEGMPPLIEEAPHKAAFRIVNDPPPKLTNPEAYSPLFNEFLASCLVKNPEKRSTASQLLQHQFIKQTDGANNAAVVELLTWMDKFRKKNKKPAPKKAKGSDLEDEATLNIYHDETKAALLVPGHVTVEDVVRNCADQFKVTKDLKSYTLFLVIEEAGGKVKEKALGTFDLPVKILKHMEKKLGKKAKTASGKEPVRFAFKTGAH